MCIIVAKEKGIKLPTKKILKNCFDYNDDGAGFMYVKNGKVIIDKGYMTFESFYKRLKELKKEFNSDLTNKSIVFHFRIGTSGKNDKETTHPFPVTNKLKDLKELYFESDLGMAHNGIISDYVYGENVSDTQNFIIDYVSILKDLNNKFLKNKKVLKMLEKEAKSKLCFLDNKENIYYVGDFEENKGVKYSNDTYKDYNYITTYNFSKQSNYSVEKETTLKQYNHGTYFVGLHKGDYYETYDEIVQVDEDAKYVVDEYFNLYEINNGVFSLIAVDVIAYDENYNIKDIFYDYGYGYSY